MGVDSQLIDEAANAAAKGAVPDGSPAMERAVRDKVREVLHKHPNELLSQHTLTFGERWAGWVARTSGSWNTILPYLGFTVVYLVINHWVYSFDQTLQYYTFAVSVLAIFLAQVILLFQNRQSDLESALAHNAYEQTGEIFAMEQQQVATLEIIHALVQRHEEVLIKLDDMMIDVHELIRRGGGTPTTPEPETRDGRPAHTA